MAKIILTIGDTVLQEMTLSKVRVTIGRHPGNDFVIENSAISAEHAAITTVLGDAMLEDLNSTNGTQINGHPIKKYFLRDNDVIELGQYKIRYIIDTRTDSNEQNNYRDIGKTSNVSKKYASRKATILKVMNGPLAGKRLSITKILTTLGCPGLQVCVITHRPAGYYLVHVEGNTYPLVNDQTIGDSMHLLAEGDVIELCGIRVRFLSR